MTHKWVILFPDVLQVIKKDQFNRPTVVDQVVLDTVRAKCSCGVEHTFYKVKEENIMNLKCPRLMLES